jgi:CspA family cold shock protein
MSDQSYTGRVKWFSDHLGYGFITCIDESALQGTDIFVHYNSIYCNTFKTLAKGEYVTFHMREVSPTRGAVAADVAGIMRGPLLCHTADVSAGTCTNAICNLHGEVHL